MRNFILVALLAIGLSCISTNANAQECPCGDACKCDPCKCPTVAECTDGTCAKPAPVVEGPQHSILAHKPVRRLAALPAKAITHTAQAVAERRPVRRLLKAAARVAIAPVKALGRVRFRPSCHR